MLKTTIEAATAAGKIIRNDFHKLKPSAREYKKDRSIVTRTDKNAERAILKIVSKKFPEHSYFSEEAGGNKSSSDFLWIIDPLDGTSNFSRKIPYFAVSIAIFYRKKILVCVVYQPITGELFTATWGRGAYLNGKRLVARGRNNKNTIVVMERGMRNKANSIKTGKAFARIIKHSVTPRVEGSIAVDLCYTACGKFDALVSGRCNLYDFAAGSLIAKEAGLAVSDFKERLLSAKASDLVVAPPRLHRKLVNIVRTI